MALLEKVLPREEELKAQQAVALMQEGKHLEALPLLARRLRDPKMLDGADWMPDSGNTGANKLPISFTPA